VIASLASLFPSRSPHQMSLRCSPRVFDTRPHHSGPESRRFAVRVGEVYDASLAF
jgi:hypothetical protein